MSVPSYTTASRHRASRNGLTGFRRGTLSASGDNGAYFDTVSTPNSGFAAVTATQAFTLDSLGNQTSTLDNGSTTISRTNNAQNQITTYLNGTNAAATLAYDNNGNLTTDEKGNDLTYDAWNRLTSYFDNTAVTVVGYNYFADQYQAGEVALDNAVLQNFTYDAQGQVIQTQNRLGDQQGYTQYVWGLGYINDLVLRDRDADENTATGDLGIASSGLDERRYYQHDANHNVTSLADESGTAKLRMVYDPYGKQAVLDGTTWTVAPGTTVAAAKLDFGFQGMRQDPVTGFYFTPNRVYDTDLSVWLQQDPAGYIDGANLYQPEQSDPVAFVDPGGLSHGSLPYPGEGGGAGWTPTLPPLYAMAPDVNPGIYGPSDHVKESSTWDNSNDECKNLLKKIANLTKEIRERQSELAENVGGLQESEPGDDILPSLSRNGHRRLLAEMIANLKQAWDDFDKRCGGGKPKPCPKRVPVPVPPSPRWITDQDSKKLIEGSKEAAEVGVGIGVIVIIIILAPVGA